jgi:Mg-chelatase subunit ChlD
VLDRGADIPSQAFLNAEAALETFIGTLQFPVDQVGIASFAASATLNQTLTNNSTAALSAFSGIIPSGGGSYIGSGIAAAQTELTGPRDNPSATPVIILLSDGADSDAPNSSATLSAANAAKAAGIQIIAVQYGTGPTTLMQSIASSSSAFYQLTQ